jgi:biofilm PGA synthesis N-glycosyltransferase PgaC
LNNAAEQQRLIIITPCHNEERHLPALIESIAKQTQLPDQWIIVDDNSSDSSAEIIKSHQENLPWLTYVKRVAEKKRDLGGRVVHVFHAGLPHIASEWDFIAKMDADIILPPDTLEKALEQFNDPAVGMAGIGFDLVDNGKKVGEETYAPYHVCGALKLYRKACYNEIGGLHSYYGWDIIDETEARRHGWLTIHDPSIRGQHRRVQGKDIGLLKGRINWGMGAYACGSHWLFTLARSFYRMAYPPYIIGGLFFLWGYFSSFFNKKVPRYGDKAYIKHIQREQLYRLFHGNKLPPSEAMKDDRN